MSIAGLMLGWMMLGQTPAATLPPISVSGQESPAAVKPDQRQRRPPEMVAEALLLPTGSALTGQPLPLVPRLGSASDRRQQLEIVRAYWRLAQAVAEYHYASDHAREMEKLKARSGEEASLRLIHAASAAQLREAELATVRAQNELAGLVRSQTEAALPLPADRPVVGAFRTLFKEMFANRTPPETARLGERTLPIQRRMIDDQAAAVQAAEDALTAMSEEYQSGRTDAASVAASSRQLLRRQKAFIQAVCGYNRTIADYIFSVVGPATSVQEVVAMLIGPVRPTMPPGSTSGDQPVRQTSADEPITMGSPDWRQPKNEPTLAPPRRKNEPTLAPPRDQLKSAGKNEPDLISPDKKAANSSLDSSQKTPLPEYPALPEWPSSSRTAKKQPLPPDDGPNPADAKKGEAREKKADSAWGNETGKKANEDPKGLGTAAPGEFPSFQNPQSPASTKEGTGSKFLDSDAAPPSAADLSPRNNPAAPPSGATSPTPPLTSNASPTALAKQLTVSFLGNRSMPEGAEGKPISLADCLMRDTGGNRLATIDAYWQVWKQSARYKILSEKDAQLNLLSPMVLERRNQPSGPAEMLRLQAAQTATKASLREAQLALVQAQYALALRTGAVADAAWPLASTAPHWGRYLLNMESLPRRLAESGSVRRLASIIPGQGEVVCQRAQAVLAAEDVRNAAAEGFQAGRATIDQVIEGIASQAEQTSAFLDSLMEYNRQIAEYVLTVFPPTTPADKIAAALVVKQ